MKLTIAQIARETGISPETVRFYIRRGLIEPIGEQDPPSLFRRTRLIRRAQELGFSLKEIKELIDLQNETDSSCAEVRQRALAKLADVATRMRDLSRMQAALTELVDSCSGDLPSRNCPILESLQA